jgi:cytochrome b561
MQWRNSTERYGALGQTFHWGMLALFTAVCLAIELKGIYPRGSAGLAGLTRWHELLGLTTAFAVSARLFWRALDTPPADLPHASALQRQAVRAMKFALYLVMVALPLTGLVAAIGRGDEVTFLGIDFNALFGPLSSATGKALKEAHEAIATGAYWLIGLHAGAALWHHFIRRDATLRRMLPARP